MEDVGGGDRKTEISVIRIWICNIPVPTSSEPLSMEPTLRGLE